MIYRTLRLVISYSVASVWVEAHKRIKQVIYIKAPSKSVLFNSLSGSEPLNNESLKLKTTETFSLQQTALYDKRDCAAKDAG